MADKCYFEVYVAIALRNAMNFSPFKLLYNKIITIR